MKTVDRTTNPCYYALLRKFFERTNCFLRKCEQDAGLAQQYQSKFDLD